MSEASTEELLRDLEVGEAEIDEVVVERGEALPVDEDEELPVLRGLDPGRQELTIGQVPARGSCLRHVPLPEVIAAFVEPDESYPEGRYEVRVRAICAECLCDFEIDLASHRPRAGGQGAVHVMRPVTD